MSTEVNQETTKSDEVLSPQISSANGKSNESQENQKRIKLTPEQLPILVMQQLNQVNAKKDELTIAIKQLSDLATQLGKICAQQNKKLQEYTESHKYK